MGQSNLGVLSYNILYIDDKYLIYPDKKSKRISLSGFKECSSWIGYNT
jgi:hypothetical protein